MIGSLTSEANSTLRSELEKITRIARMARRGVLYDSSVAARTSMDLLDL